MILRRVRWAAKGLVPHALRVRWAETQERRRAVPGVPEGLSLELLGRLCRDVHRTALRQVSYVQLSGWKTSGTFRLFVDTDSGIVWRLVYKNALYSACQIPALKGLPVSPGPPEHLIQKVQKGSLVEFLPRVYWSQEVQADTLYRYLWEDLAVDYSRPGHAPNPRRYLLCAAERLPALQRALKESFHEKNTPGLLRFDHAYGSTLMDYAQKSLSSYAQESSDPVVCQAMDLWPQLSSFYLSDEFQENRPEGFVHGDYNPSNIYIHAKDNSRIKVVDWEWAGWGVLHADLASLTKACDRLFRQEAVRRFAKQMEGLSLSEHWKWYRWCRLERGLLDAAFLARQQMESQRRVAWMPGRILTALRTALDVYQECSQ